MSNPYYQEELEYLRELGREFARENPALAPTLAEAGSDPDVERVLEGVAFLTGLIRKRLDDDFPELTQTLVEMTWPHYLRPVPSMSIVEFNHPAKPKVSVTQHIRRGEVELESVPVDGTPCRFRTSYDVEFQPLRVAGVQTDSSGRGSLRIRFQILGNAKIEELELERLRLYLHGDVSQMSMLYLWLLRHTRDVQVVVPAGGRRTREHTLGRDRAPVRPVGLAADEGLLPYPGHSFLGYRLLQEYFALPQKFLFVDIHGLDVLPRLEAQGEFELVFHWSERLPESIRVEADHLRLHCTPVVNLLSMSADPLVITPERMSYPLRPAASDPNHFEVHTVDRVIGLLHGRSGRREYDSYFSFRHGLQDEREALFYKISRRPGVGRSNSDCHISFVSVDEKSALPEAESVSIDLTCTNRTQCEGLRPGDIHCHTDSTPEYAEFRNISPLTRSVLPPLEGGLHWRLISHLALNFTSLSSLDGLRGALRVYNFGALYDRQAARALELRLDAITRIDSGPEERIFHGAPVRGVHTRLELDEDGFSSDGELYLFASVLEEFLALYVSVNSFSHLSVRTRQQSEVYEWKPRVGSQIIL